LYQNYLHLHSFIPFLHITTGIVFVTNYIY